MEFRDSAASRRDNRAAYRVGETQIMDFVRGNLQLRAVVAFQSFGILLAFFDDDNRERLWKRLLSEVLDVPGFGVLLLPSDSPLLPSSSLMRVVSDRVRGHILDEWGL